MRDYLVQPTQHRAPKRDPKTGKVKDPGILASTKDVKNLSDFQIDSETARGVASMILAALEPTATTTKKRVSVMQLDLKAKFEP